MLRLSKQSDYATLLMSHMARAPQQLRNVGDLAQATRMSVPMVSKTLKLLARSGLIESVRGSAGGYKLGQMPQQISIADIVNAIEGPIAITQCSSKDTTCALHDHCQVRPHWQIINATINQSLKQLSLAELLGPAHRMGAAPQGH